MSWECLAGLSLANLWFEDAGEEKLEALIAALPGPMPAAQTWYGLRAFTLPVTNGHQSGLVVLGNNFVQLRSPHDDFASHAGLMETVVDRFKTTSSSFEAVNVVAAGQESLNVGERISRPIADALGEVPKKGAWKLEAAGWRLFARYGRDDRPYVVDVSPDAFAPERQIFVRVKARRAGELSRQTLRGEVEQHHCFMHVLLDNLPGLLGGAQ